MDVDVRFFQAAATAIPTLFIALAITGKAFSPDDGDGGHLSTPRNLKEFTQAILLITSFATAEMVSLAVIFTNRPYFLWAIVVGFVIGLQLTTLFTISISAGLRKFDPPKARTKLALAVLVAVAVGAPTLVFLAMTMIPVLEAATSLGR
ncbi:hypothetical protein [Arthrobacter sp. UYEF3]|uniref:hypothetical protein n=1 Tax=Arthrobacter sp. UYEF3 TaxID=1756365 RepID=UPI0033910F91